MELMSEGRVGVRGDKFSLRSLAQARRQGLLVLGRAGLVVRAMDRVLGVTGHCFVCMWLGFAMRGRKRHWFVFFFLFECYRGC